MKKFILGSYPPDAKAIRMDINGGNWLVSNAALVYLAADADAHIAELEDLLRCWLANHVGALAASELYQVAKRTSEIVGSK